MHFDDVLSSALENARAMGADYAEARSEDSLTESLHVRNGAVERLSQDRDSGWGIHVLAGGGWGFAASSALTQDAIREVVELAVNIARASGSKSTARTDLAIMP